MSNSIENEENLYLSVKESFNRGVIRGPSQSNFFEFFDFIGNPFDPSFLITNQKLIAKSTKVIINKLAERIGACHKNERHLILVGPECSGRSTILKIIENFLNKGFDMNFSLYVNAQDRWSGYTTEEDGSDDHFDRIDNFQQWVKEVDFQNSRIILVDDGAATGSTLVVSARWIKKRKPKKIIIAIPVAPNETVELLKNEVDKVVTILIPPTSNFTSVAQFYDNFEEITDDKVVKIMKELDEK